MTYEELDIAVEAAWSNFFDVLGYNGVDTAKVYDSLNRKDCFNDVMGAVLSVVKLEVEDEDD